MERDSFGSLVLVSEGEPPDPARRLIVEELAGGEFMPEICRIVWVTGCLTPCTWSVETDGGSAGFVPKSKESIRRLSGSSLLIAGSRGFSFLG